MSSKGDLIRTQAVIRGALGTRESKRARFVALMGDGAGTIKVPGEQNFVYVRTQGRGRVDKALNVRLAPRNDLPIIVGYTAENPSTLEVLEVDWAAITEPGNYAYVAHHHQSHELHNTDGGDDVVWVQKQQIVPMLCMPTDPVSMQVVVLEDWYPWAAGWHYFAGAISADLSGYVPALAGRARFVLISIDGATNTLQYTSGSEFTFGLPLTSIDVRVPPPPLGSVPVCAVYITGATTYLGWENLYDLRLLNSPGAGSIVPYPDLWENVIIIAKSGGQWVLVQDGLDAADNGDTVLVMPGVYAEDLTSATLNITLLGLAAKHVTGPYGARIGGDAAEVGPALSWNGSGTICDILFNRELTLAGGGYTVVLITGSTSLIDCRVHFGEGATGRNILPLSVGGAGDTIDISRCHILSPGASSPTAVSLNGGTVEITDSRFYGDIICTAATTVKLVNCYVDGDLTGMAGCDLILTNNVVTGAVAGWDSVTYRGLSDLPLGTAHQIAKVNAGATDPIWASFDWDEISAAVGADMVHDHSAASEGGALPATQIGQVFFSIDGATLAAQVPLTGEAGWLVEEVNGVLLVVD